MPTEAIDTRNFESLVTLAVNAYEDSRVPQTGQPRVSRYRMGLAVTRLLSELSKPEEAARATSV